MKPHAPLSSPAPPPGPSLAPSSGEQPAAAARQRAEGRCRAGLLAARRASGPACEVLQAPHCARHTSPALATRYAVRRSWCSLPPPPRAAPEATWLRSAGRQPWRRSGSWWPAGAAAAAAMPAGCTWLVCGRFAAQTYLQPSLSSPRQQQSSTGLPDCSRDGCSKGHYPDGHAVLAGSRPPLSWLLWRCSARNCICTASATLSISCEPPELGGACSEPSQQVKSAHPSPAVCLSFRQSFHDRLSRRE